MNKNHISASKSRLAPAMNYSLCLNVIQLNIANELCFQDAKKN